MRRTYSRLPGPRKRINARANAGIIGCGNYAYSHIAYYLHKRFGHVIHGAADVDVNKAASFYERYKLNYYTDNAERIVTDPQVDVIFIASNHASHAEYAIDALNKNKSVHIEKPHVVNEDQLRRLCAAMRVSRGRVNLGFNRPKSPFGVLIKHALDAQQGAAIYNWFVAGHEIEPDHWYFKSEEGGRVLGNLCHWTDFVYQMMPPKQRFPVLISPTRSEKSDCDIAVTFKFGDGTIAAITFSAKGHTFEGVRERFSAHRGNVLVSMDDYHRLVIENVDKKVTYSSFFRDHGHERNIADSYRMSSRTGSNPFPGCTEQYVWETGQLFLKTKEALDANRSVMMYGYPEDQDNAR
jgi:predicted dehydrogenase